MDRLLTGKELCERLRISPTTRWRYVISGKLPPPRKFHPNGRNTWRESEISEIIESLPVAEAYQNIEAHNQSCIDASRLDDSE